MFTVSASVSTKAQNSVLLKRSAFQRGPRDKSLSGKRNRVGPPRATGPLPVLRAAGAAPASPLPWRRRRSPRGPRPPGGAISRASAPPLQLASGRGARRTSLSDAESHVRDRQTKTEQRGSRRSVFYYLLAV